MDSKTTQGQSEPYTCSPSTTSDWKWAKIRQRPKGQTSSRPQAGRSWFSRLPAWPLRRRKLTLTITYRGGAEAWFEIHARGGDLRTPGSTALLDLMRLVCNNDF